MKLHQDKESFNTLVTLTSYFIGVPESAVKRDYYIVMLLQNLQNSEFADKVIFKGGTSLSKCYPGSINRFSEDIDLTYFTQETLSDHQYSNNLKKIEKAITGNAHSEKIEGERNNRSKSSLVWFDDDDKDNSKIKLEIGSNVRPDPYARKSMTTYIQQYLIANRMLDIAEEFELVEIVVNTLNIERTFLDKIFSIKRHAICGRLAEKVRHIYDVTKLFRMAEIQTFLLDKQGLKDLIIKTKDTDSYYFERRNISLEYNPMDAYSFENWRGLIDDKIRINYEHLHETLLYTDIKQNITEAIETLEQINRIFNEIKE